MYNNGRTFPHLDPNITFQPICTAFVQLNTMESVTSTMKDRMRRNYDDSFFGLIFFLNNKVAIYINYHLLIVVFTIETSISINATIEEWGEFRGIGDLKKSSVLVLKNSASVVPKHSTWWWFRYFCCFSGDLRRFRYFSCFSGDLRRFRYFVVLVRSQKISSPPSLIYQNLERNLFFQLFTSFERILF